MSDVPDTDEWDAELEDSGERRNTLQTVPLARPTPEQNARVQEAIAAIPQKGRPDQKKVDQGRRLQSQLKPEQRSGGGRKPITREMYARMMAAYREAPGNYDACARNAKVHRDTAKKAWLEGWPLDRYPFAVPLGPVIKREMEDARALLLELNRNVSLEDRLKQIENEKKARAHAVKSRADEGQLLELGRANVMGTLAALANLQPVIFRMTAKLKDQLEAEVLRGDLKPENAMKILRDAGSVVRMASAGITELMEAERLYLGEPGKIIGVQIQSRDQAMETLKRVASIVKRAEEPDDVVIDVTPEPIGTAR